MSLKFAWQNVIPLILFGRIVGELLKSCAGDVHEDGELTRVLKKTTRTACLRCDERDDGTQDAQANVNLSAVYIRSPDRESTWHSHSEHSILDYPRTHGIHNVQANAGLTMFCSFCT
jgi:hypothetical protein